MHSTAHFIVDSERNAIIVCPDNLISPSKITGSITCLRRSVLSDIVSYAASEGKLALLGTVRLLRLWRAFS